MKKHTALTAFALLTPLAAQADVTLYGTLDETFESVRAVGASTGKDVKSVNRISSNSSLIGFKGNEDLGNGLKAIWQVESNIWVDSAPAYATLGTRDTFIGLSGPAGTLQAGLISPPTRVLAGTLDVNQGNTGIGMSGALLGKLGNTLAADPLLKTFGSANPADGNGNTLVRISPFDTRRKNTLAYTSPKWNGLSASVMYDAVETRSASATSRPYAFDLGLKYHHDAWLLQAAYAQITTGIDDAPLSASQFKTVRNARVGGYYQFGSASRVGLLFDRTVGKLTPTAAGGFEGSSITQNVWYAQAVLGVGAQGRVISQYGQAGKLQGVAYSGASQSQARHFELGYEYDLSKRTTLKAIYSQLWNQNNAAYDFGFGSVGDVAAGASPRGLAVGLRHNF
jgi:predicted porin